MEIIKKILIITDFDSRIKWSFSLANILNAKNVFAYIREKNEHLKEYEKSNYESIKYSNLNELFRKGFINYKCYDIIILSLGGSANVKFLSFIQDNYKEERPIIISGFNGIVDPYDIHGLLCRVGSDLICTNSENDYNKYSQSLNALNLKNVNLVNSGYLRNYLSLKKDNKLYKKNCDIKKILFIEQVSLPKHKEQKKYLINNLYNMSISNKDKLIYVKLRDFSDKEHMNLINKKQSFRYLWNKLIKTTPNNVIFYNNTIESIISKVDLCISFTSTSLIEALILNKEVAVINDFGISTDIGNHIFIGSNLFCSLENIFQDKIPKVNKVWYENNCNYGSDYIQNIKKEIERLLIQKLQGKLPKIELYYNENEFKYFHRLNYKQPNSLFKLIKRRFFNE